MSILLERTELIEEELQNILKQWQDDFVKNKVASLACENLIQSVRYSLLGSGKRFRPQLCLMVAESFGVHPKNVLAFACAVEMIHTYSLIHDDLPMLDNDSIRRGRPTNHIVFGEALALLAGDTLLTEAFTFLAKSYSNEPAKVVTLIQILGEAAGFQGMVSGQVIDLEAKKNNLSLEMLEQMHALKTGALIRVCCEGAAVICGLNANKQNQLREFGGKLGFAFQLQDDLLDSAVKIEKGSWPDHIGLQKTKDKLHEVSGQASFILGQLNLVKSPLMNLVEWNLNRLN